MKAEVTVSLYGAKHRLAMPIGGLEKLAEDDSLTAYPMEMLQALHLGMWKASELSAIIRVGLEMGSATICLEDLEAEMTTGDLRELALALMDRALKDDSGNFGAAAFPQLDGSGSRPVATS